MYKCYTVDAGYKNTHGSRKICSTFLYQVFNSQYPLIVNVINIPFIPGTIKYTMYKIHVYITVKSESKYSLLTRRQLSLYQKYKIYSMTCI